MSIFHHIDRDGDDLEVLAGTHLEFHVAGKTGAGIAVHVDRDAALRLHAALGEWLYPVHTPEWANKSLIEQMIEKAVKDQVAAVLPLHLKPGDRFLMADADGRVWADPEPHDVGHAEEPAAPYTPPVHMTTEDKCQVHACGSRHLEAGPCDSPLEPGQRLIEVHDCGYVWAMHKAAKPEPTDHGRLMSELPVRTRPRPICVSCGHGWGEHTSGVCWGDDPRVTTGLGCRCTRERPGTAGTA